MKVLLIFIFSLVIVKQVAGQGADTLRNSHHYYYLADLNLSVSAKLILTDSISPGDNYITFSAMDSIISERKKVRDFYFPVFQKIVQKSDGALAEVVGAYVLAYVKRYPKEFATRYSCCSKSKTCCDELLTLGSHAGGEIMLRPNDKQEYIELVAEMTKHYRNWKSDKLLKMFMERVNNTRLNWRN